MTNATMVNMWMIMHLTVALYLCASVWRAVGAARPQVSLLAAFLLATITCCSGRFSLSANRVHLTCLGPAVFGVGFFGVADFCVCVCAQLQ